ncbi:unnamed protein product, partial [Heterotrigona itama]
TSVDSEATPMLISDVHCLWKHGGRVSHDRPVYIEIDDDSLRGPAIKSLKLTPFVVTRYMDPSGKQSQHDTSTLGKRLETEHVECILNPAVYRKLLERDGHIVSRNSKRRYHRRQLSWKLQNPFYVEEPNWVEINNDGRENHSRHNLETVDPYIISRGKKFHERLTNIVNDTRSEESSIEYEDLRVILADDLKTMRDRRSTNLNSRLGTLNRNSDDHDEDDNGDRREENLKKAENEEKLDDIVAGYSNTRLEENRNEEDEEHLTNTKKRSADDLKLINNEKPLFAGRDRNEFGEFESGESTFNKQGDKRGLIFKKTPYRSGEEIVSRAIYTPEKTSRMPVELATASGNAIGEKSNSLLFRVRMKRDSKPANSAVVKSIAVESAYRPNRVRKMANYFERERRNGVGGLDVLNDILEQPYFISRGKKINDKEVKKISFESEGPKSTMDSIIGGEKLRQDRMSEREKRIKGLEDHFGIDMKGLVKLEQPYFISRGKKNNYADDGRIFFEQLKSEMDDIVSREKLREDLKCDSSNYEDRTNEREKRIKELEHHLGVEMKGIVKDLLTNFDPYYVARGKRVLLPSLNESF